MSELTARARELLDGITPGDWEWSKWGALVADRSASVLYPDHMTEGVEANNPVDAEFIAAAPQLVADLLHQVEQDAMRMAEWRAQHHDLTAALERVEKLADKIATTPKWDGTPSQINCAFAGQIRDALEGKL